MTKFKSGDIVEVRKHDIGWLGPTFQGVVAEYYTESPLGGERIWVYWDSLPTVRRHIKTEDIQHVRVYGPHRLTAEEMYEYMRSQDE